MEDIKGVSIDIVDNYLQTNGLKLLIEQEIKLKMYENDKERYLKLLRYLIKYFFDYKPLLKAHQTIAYHSWLLKFVPANNGIWSIYEAERNGDGFVEGAEYAVKVIAQQEHICNLYNAIPQFPNFSQMVAVSDGVLEGLPVDAVRYDSPEHMTGWWLTTNLFDGNIQSLKTIHFYHVAFSRPDLIKYLALPFGYRFFIGNVSDVWFDKSVLE